MELVWITGAEYVGDYAISLTFKDGKRGVVNLAPYLSIDAFHALRDPEVFKAFSLDGWTVTWLDGELDIAPETLHAAIS